MMNLIPTAEQQGVADSIAAYVSENLPVERHQPRLGETMKTDAEAWPELAELGCFGLSLEADLGGVGFTLAEEALAFREYGRYLVSPAMLSTVLAVRIGLAAGLKDVAAALIAGKQRAGIAKLLDTAVGPSAEGSFHLLDVRAQDYAVAWDSKGAALYAPGSFECAGDMAALDSSVAIARGHVKWGKPLAWIDAETTDIPSVAAMLSAAMLVGIAEAVRNMAVGHAKTRVQFGVPIGTFQGVKHKCADMAIWAEMAWAETACAALALREPLPDAAFHAVNAAMLAGEAAMLGTRHNIQIHGGMGFTAELSAHLFLKRAHLLRQLSGNATDLHRRLLSLRLDT